MALRSLGTAASRAKTAQYLGRERDLLGHGPPPRDQLSGQRAPDLRRVVAPCAAWSIASTEAHLGLPTAGLDRLGELCQSQWQMPPDVGGGARGPRPCDQGTTGMDRPRVGDAPLTAPLSRR